MPTLRDLVATLDEWFPPGLAESWDAVGLVVGDPAREVSRVALAVDPTEAVVAEAIAAGADLLVTHHPLLLTAVHSVAATSAKGRTVHRLIAGDCALYCAHTNADQAAHGVNDALAALLGLTETVAIEPAVSDLLSLVVYVPSAERADLVAALSGVGVGRLGDYDNCAYATSGQGQFRPLESANPTIGAVGEVTQVQEDRVEMVLPRHLRDTAAHVLRAHHSYEEPAFHFAPVSRPEPIGHGRIGTVAEQTLGDFAAFVASALPATAAGIRVAGDVSTLVRRVAVCGGSGGSFLPTVADTVDVFVTSDLKHHVVDDHLSAGGCAVIDTAHWASEFPWCGLTAQRLAARGLSVHVIDTPTDPWTAQFGGSS